MMFYYGCDDGRWKHMGMVIILLLLANS